MRILPFFNFNAYGEVPSEALYGDSGNTTKSLYQKISDGIAKNEAMRLALMALSDQEQEKKKKRHRYKVLNRKQVKVLFSQLCNINVDIRYLLEKYAKDDSSNDNEEDDSSNKKKRGVQLFRHKKNVKIGTSAAEAIAHAAEAWVIARNKGVLDMASFLFSAKDDLN